MHKYILLLSFFSLISCNTNYQVVDTRGGFIKIDSSFNSSLSPGTLAYISSKKQALIHEMSTVLGTASENISNQERNYNPLANIIADLIKDEASLASNKKIDFAVINIGALRCEIPKGNITLKQVYELLPFTNALCVMHMKGSDVKELFKQIASRGGEGVSKDIKLTISPEGELIDAKINCKSIQPDNDYMVATIEYLTEGNDGMSAFLKATDMTSFEYITLRDLFIRHIVRLNNEGKMLNPEKDIRITINNTSL